MRAFTRMRIAWGPVATYSGVTPYWAPSGTGSCGIGIGWDDELRRFGYPGHGGE
jgi:hypothetical protein